MLEFKVIQELEPNNEILNIIKNSTFTTKNGRLKHLLKTNLQFIESTEYLITYPTLPAYTALISNFCTSGQNFDTHFLSSTLRWVACASLIDLQYIYQIRTFTD